MNPAKRLSSSDSHATHLVNLFAYIRDLFTTTRPVSRYNEGTDFLSWPIAQFHHLAFALTNTILIHCQWDYPTRPLLSLSRGENVSPIDIPETLRAKRSTHPAASFGFRSETHLLANWLCFVKLPEVRLQRNTAEQEV